MNILFSDASIYTKFYTNTHIIEVTSQWQYVMDSKPSYFRLCRKNNHAHSDQHSPGYEQLKDFLVGSTLRRAGSYPEVHRYLPLKY